MCIKSTYPFDFDSGLRLRFDSGFSWIWIFSLAGSPA